MVMRLSSVFFFLLFAVLSNIASSDARINIAQFESENIEAWQSKAFAGETQYRIVVQNDRKFLQAVSEGSASGIAKKITVDLIETPYLNWSWRISNSLMGMDETSKQGDDYAARLYVVIDGGWQIWKTKALNYVWSSNQKQGESWDNAFAKSNAKMLAVKGRSAAVNVWFVEKRNVYQDLIKQFGDKGSAEKNRVAYRYIDAVAIMTDTDNSLSSATAYYGDIFFSEK
jgi:hypothetical protein